MSMQDYTGGDTSVGITAGLTISHNVGGIVIGALLFLVALRFFLQKHMV